VLERPIVLLTRLHPLTEQTARPNRIAQAAARVVLGALLLMSVVLIDGRPVVFADTNIYYWMGEMQFRPVRYALAPVLHGPASAAQDPEAADEQPSEMTLRRTEMAARSPWFGMLLFAVAGWGNLWWLTLVQSLAAAVSVHALWRALAPGGGWRGWIGLMAGLAAASTLPFFAGFAMPDFWAGTGLVALACLLFHRDRFGAASQWLLGGLVLCAVAFHQSNGLVAIAATFALGIAAVRLARWSPARLAPGAAVLAGSVLLALALNAGYAGAIRYATGETLRAPPFLAARVLADGPGRTYLRAACARGEAWALCRFKTLPLNDSQDILWSGDKSRGVFGQSSAAERVRIDAEQTRFVIAAVLSDPLGELRAASANFGRALVQVQLEDPLRDPHFYLTDPDWRDTYIADLVHALGPCGKGERACRPRFTEAQSGWWHGGVFALSLAFIGWRLSRRDVWTRLASGDDEAQRMLLTFGFFLVALLVNAAVTGVLSGPFPRYQARIAWIAPACAILLALRIGVMPKPGALKSIGDGPVTH